MLGKERKGTYNPADFNNARFISFSFEPKSKKAKALGNKLGTLIIGSGDVPVNRGRPIKIDDVAHAAVTIVAEVLDSTKGDVRRSVYHGLSPKDFTGHSISSRHFTRAMNGLQKLKLLKKTRGYWYTKSMFGDFASPDTGIGKATRWQPRQKLFDLCKSSGITHKNLDDHFQTQLPKNVLSLRSSKKMVGHRPVRGRYVKFPESETTLSLKAEIQEINEFLSTHKLVGATHRGYRRCFNQGDKPETYAWNKGGRLSGSGGDENYLTIKKEKRHRMRIDGEKTVEIDIRASFLTIFHALHGVALDVMKDPYAVPGLPRGVVKYWILIAFGSGKPPNKWTSKAGKDYLESSTSRKSLGKDYPIKDVTQKLLAAYPVLKKLKAGGIDCFDLMYLESNAIVASMLKLLRLHRIPAYSVHDCLVVKQSDQEIAEMVLSEEYEKAIGITPFLKVT